MDEKEYGIDHVSIRRGLDNTFLVVECGREYTEDYQMRMLEENDMGGILCPRGHGEEGISMYEYDISGKISLKSKYKEMKIDMKEMIKFITGLLNVVREIHDHLLDADHLLLDPEYIFWEDGAYFFCYYPGGGWNVWEAFHRLRKTTVCTRSPGSWRTCRRKRRKERGAVKIRGAGENLWAGQAECCRKAAARLTTHLSTTGSQSRTRDASCVRRKICGARSGISCAATKSRDGGTGMAFI